jgi:hypothetical protein
LAVEISQISQSRGSDAKLAPIPSLSRGPLRVNAAAKLYLRNLCNLRNLWKKSLLPHPAVVPDHQLRVLPGLDRKRLVSSKAPGRAAGSFRMQTTASGFKIDPKSPLGVAREPGKHLTRDRPYTQPGLVRFIRAIPAILWHDRNSLPECSKRFVRFLVPPCALCGLCGEGFLPLLPAK